MPIHLTNNRNIRIRPSNPTDMNMPIGNHNNLNKRNEEYEKKIQKMQGDISLIKMQYEHKLIEQIGELSNEYQKKIIAMNENYQNTIEEMDKEHKEIMAIARSNIDISKKKLDDIEVNGTSEIKDAIDSIEEKLKDVEVNNGQASSEKPIVKKKKKITAIYPKSKTMKSNLNTTIAKKELPKWR